jgi:CDP-diacylglycerol--glycerol-3-phosphate 3-phosphatidyltransferase
MERPERIVLIILGALFNRWGVMAPVLWVLAVLSTITVIHRIRYTYMQTRGLAPVTSTDPIVLAGAPRQTAPEFPAAASNAPRIRPSSPSI